MKTTHLSHSAGHLLLTLSLASYPLRAADFPVTGNLSVSGTSTLTGNVGIGTASPATKLHVENNGNVRITLKDSSNGTGKYLQLEQDGDTIYFNDTGVKSIMTMGLTSGNVGIGTTSPAYTLHATGDIGVSGNQQFFARYNGTEFYKGSFGWSHLQLGNDGPNWIVAGRTATGGALTFVVNNTSGYAYNAFDGIQAMHITSGGNVGIGTTSPSHKLAVNGTIKAKEVMVDLSGWPDFVFADDYRLAPLGEVERHIRDKKHLPGIPSAAEVEAGGVSLGDMQARLLAKVEELTLHAIAQAKRLDEQAARLAALEEENRRLRSR